MPNKSAVIAILKYALVKIVSLEARIKARIKARISSKFGF